MSSAARKPQPLPFSPVITERPSDHAALSTTRLNVINRNKGEDEAASSPLSAVFERVFQTLRSLCPEGDLMISHCSAISQSCRVEYAAGSFAHLKGQSLDVSRGPFAEVLVETENLRLADASQLIASESAFAKLGAGQAAIVRIDLAGDRVALIAYFQPKSVGPLVKERVDAIRSVAELAGEAACASDLTLDVQAQQLHLDTLRTEIEEVQQFYRQFSDAIKQCFWVLDVDTGKVLVVSDNFERVWGANKRILHDGLTGFMSSVLPADRDRVLSEFHTHLGSELDTELRVINEDGDEKGEVRWIWLRAFPTRDHISQSMAVSHTRRIVLIADDITEKKMEEETIRAREAELVSRARTLAVSDLASGVAHEINNPLTIIVGKAAEIKRLLRKSSTAEDRAALEALTDKIQSTSIRISEIVTSLKALSRNEKDPVFHKTALSKVFNDLRDMCTERFKSYGVRLEIPDFPAALAAEMNPTLVSQMILNLLNNGLDAVEKLEQKWVKVEFAQDEHSVFLYVTDSGSGIPIKFRSRIFDPFFTTKEPGKGTGLGLSLAAGIAAHHHGLLRLDNLHPHTRFVVQLPKAQGTRKKP